MSIRQGSGKGAMKRPRNDEVSANEYDDQTNKADSNNELVSKLDTSASHDMHHMPRDCYWESVDTDVNTTDTTIPHDSQSHPDLRTRERRGSPSSSVGSVCREKDSKGRFVGSVTSSYGARKKNVNSWVVKQAMPGGPTDIRLLKSYGGHVAVDIWNGNPRGVLTGVNRASHCKTLAKWKKIMDDEVVKLVDGTEGGGLSFLADIMFDHLDMPLLSAFVERWQPDTNTFHLPFGEMTITLHDVFHILRIPVEGRLVGCESQTTDEILVTIGGLIKKDPFQMLDEGLYENGGVLTSSIIDACRPKHKKNKRTLEVDASASLIKRTPEVEASGFLMALLGTTLFSNKCKTRVSSMLYTIVQDLNMVHTYSWGSATLAFLYRQLGIASRSQCKILGGCLSLLQAWIYEYFHKFRPQRAPLIVEPNMPRVLAWDVKVENKHDIRLETFRKLLDDYTADEVTWLPFGPEQHVKVPRTSFVGYIQYFDIIEPYMPDRVLRQLGFKQPIPKPPFGYDDASRPASAYSYMLKVAKSNLILWDRFSQLTLTDSMRASDPSSALDDNYLDWYYMVSHPFIMPLEENIQRKADVSSGKWCWERYVEMSMVWLNWNFEDVQPENVRDLIVKQRDLMLKYLASSGITPTENPHK